MSLSTHTHVIEINLHTHITGMKRDLGQDCGVAPAQHNIEATSQPDRQTERGSDREASTDLSHTETAPTTGHTAQRN